MTAAATLADSLLTVEPGEEVTTQIVVRNTGSVVDEFLVDIVGEPAGWATSEPASVSLFPGAEETVTVRFHPPRAPHVEAGAKPFAVKVTPQEEPEASRAEEGTIDVAPYSDLSAELLPRTAKGRRRATYDLAVDNRGNAHVNAALSAADADELLDFELSPDGLVVEPGHAAFGKVRARPRKSVWWGQPQTRQFQVLVEADQPAPLLAVDGTMLQEPRIPRWLPKLLVLLVLVAIALAVLWFTVLRPTLEAAAEQAAEEEVAEVADQAAEAQETAEQAGEAASAAEEQATEAEQTAAEAEEAAENAEQGVNETQGQIRSQDLGDPFDFRLGQSVGPGAEVAATRTVPDDQRYSITDVVLQNPEGDTGELQLRRETNGEVQELIEVRLENFRDLDYHFVSPVRFEGGEVVSLLISCENEEEACDPAAYLTGFQTTVEEEDGES